ncbi:MAG TPA: S1 RNA-binding domain-containing protein, partial [Thermoanaerobaculia bacterium]|nr:S1 RNA-binding domain-containing protein [Thermoanaerobaculia bacterium]
SRVADFGVFVQIDGLVEGLMHVSETGLPRGAKPQEHFHEGEPIRARILRVDDAEMKIGLSAVPAQPAAEAPAAAAAPATEAPAETPTEAPPPKKRRTRKKADDASSE